MDRLARLRARDEHGNLHLRVSDEQSDEFAPSVSRRADNAYAMHGDTIPVLAAEMVDNPLLKVPPARRRNRTGARGGSPREAGGTCRRGAIMNSARALGKCLRNMISTCESGQTHRSAPTKTPLCRGNPMWLPPVRMVAPVENSLLIRTTRSTAPSGRRRCKSP